MCVQETSWMSPAEVVAKRVRPCFTLPNCVIQGASVWNKIYTDVLPPEGQSEANCQLIKLKGLHPIMLPAG